MKEKNYIQPLLIILLISQIIMGYGLYLAVHKIDEQAYTISNMSDSVTSVSDTVNNIDKGVSDLMSRP